MKTKVTLIKDASGLTKRVRIGDQEFAVEIAAPAVIGETVGVNLFVLEAEVSATIGGVTMPGVHSVGSAPMNGKTVRVIGIADTDTTIETAT